MEIRRRALRRPALVGASWLHEFASLEGRHFRRAEIEPLAIHPRRIEALTPVGFNAGWIVGPDRVDQRAGLGADFRAAGR
jgi:hypothetical protein